MSGDLTTLLDTKLVRLAHELAMGIREPDDILLEAGISSEEWDRLRADRHFGDLLTSKVAEWNGASNTPQRVKIKALALLELNLDQFQDALQEGNTPTKVEIAKFLARLGGMDGPAAGDRGAAGGAQGPQPGFQVRIFIGKDASPMVIEGSAEPAGEG